MRPKARGLAQHGGPPGWLEERNSVDEILYMMDGPFRLPFPYRTGCPDRINQEGRFYQTSIEVKTFFLFLLFSLS
jgi:hypothetical protein